MHECNEEDDQRHCEEDERSRLCSCFTERCVTVNSDADRLRVDSALSEICLYLAEPLLFSCDVLEVSRVVYELGGEGRRYPSLDCWLRSF